MKKTLIIVLCCMALSLVACKKHLDPTPVDYTENYVGNYIENIGMEIAKTEQFNEITVTVTVDNETRQTLGTATKEKADFETVHLVIDKPDQLYKFNLDLKMEGTKESDTLNITGTFSGDGTFTFNGVENFLNEVSGNLSGNLVKQ